MQSLSYFSPYRFSENDKNNILSLHGNFWTNFTPYSSSDIFQYQLTDHLPIFLNLYQPDTNSNKEKHKISFRIQNTVNIDKFTSELTNIDWDIVLNNEIFDVNYEKFSRIIEYLHNKCFPTATKYISFNKLTNPWIATDILKNIKLKNSLFKKL